MRQKYGVVIVTMLLLAFTACSPKNEQSAAPESKKQEESKKQGGGASSVAEGPSQPRPAPEGAEYLIRLALTDQIYVPRLPILQWEQGYALVDIFKSLVETLSNGRVGVEIYANEQLGKDIATIEMLRGGDLEAVLETGVMGGIYPPFEIINVPYLFKNPAVAWRVFDYSSYWKNLTEDMRQKTGMRLLAMGQNGNRNFTHASKFLKSPEDLNGEKIRVMQSPIFVEMMKALGANAVPIAWGELYTSLQTGVVKGQENPISIIASSGLYRIQPYLTLDGHAWSEDALLINDKFFSSLPKDLQEIVLIAANQAATVGRAAETIQSFGPGGLDFLRENGVNVYVPTAKELQVLADTAQPEVLQYLREKVGDQVVDGMLAAVKDAEKSLGME